MATITINKTVWNPQQINRSGIRRLRLVDAYKIEIDFVTSGIKALSDIEVYEFTFPKEVTAGFVSNKQPHENGQHIWQQTLSFALPQMNETLMQWFEAFQQTRWVAIIEDQNMNCYLLGGEKDLGLELTTNITTGQGLADRNISSLSFQANQLRPLAHIDNFETAITLE